MQVVMQVAEQRKQTVHKARPMPKYTRLEVNVLFIQRNILLIILVYLFTKNEVNVLFYSMQHSIDIFWRWWLARRS